MKTSSWPDTVYGAIARTDKPGKKYAKIQMQISLLNKEHLILHEYGILYIGRYLIWTFQAIKINLKILTRRRLLILS
jgi:hypothetical protein